MKCMLCTKTVNNNFVVKNRKAYHLICLCQARDKQRETKVVHSEFIECNYCHKNCRDNHITYKGYWFHPLCFGTLLVKRVGPERAEQVKEEVFNVTS